MTLTLDLEPEIESRVRAYAAAEGVSVEELIARVFPPRPKEFDQAPIATRKAPRLQVLSREQAVRLNAPTIQRLEAELSQAENATPDEVAQAEAEWQSLQQALNDNRRITGERLLFPETTQPQP